MEETGTSSAADPDGHSSDGSLSACDPAFKKARVGPGACEEEDPATAVKEMASRCDHAIRRGKGTTTYSYKLFPPDGTYRLGAATHTTARLSLWKDALPRDSVQVQELWEFREQVPPTRNRYFSKDGKSTAPEFIHRKQASFTTGRAYDFSGQNNHCISDEAQWPSLVTGVLQHAQRTRLPHEPCPNIVHANWYASGKDALGAHADDEVGIDKTYGITGYTFYTQPALALQRSVQFYVPGEAGHTTVHSVPLPDASCYKMEGDFQQVYKHGMRPQGTRLFQGTQRISLIVRCMLDLGAPSSATVL